MSYSKRIVKELEKLSAKENSDVGIYKSFSDKKNFYGYIKGPSDSPFANGYFKLFIHLSDDYPFSPPVIKFMTPVYHPNISSATGAICLDILKDKWTAAMGIETALLSIQSLLTDPVPEDPQDHVVAVMYMEDLSKYKVEATKWTEKFAKEDFVTENESMISAFSKRFDELLVTAAHNCWVPAKLKGELIKLSNKK